MTYLYYAVIGIIAIAFLFGIKKWIQLIIWSWYDNGALFTVSLAIFIVLFISPAFIKQFAPHYYGYSIWALILYTAVLLFYRWNKTGFKDEEG